MVQSQVTILHEPGETGAMGDCAGKVKNLYALPTQCR